MTKWNAAVAAISIAARFGTHMEPFDWYVPQTLSRLEWVDTTVQLDSDDE